MNGRSALTSVGLALVCLGFAGCAGSEAAVEEEALENAEQAVTSVKGSWQVHPTIDANWFCSSLRVSGSLAAQNCVIVQDSSYQTALLVQNRSTSAASVSATAGLREMDTEYSCGSTSVAANDYAVCLGEKRANLSLWTRLTAEGRAMSAAGKIEPAPYAKLLGSSVGSVHANAGYAGVSTPLVAGAYNRSTLAALGLADDTVSSIRVASGHTAYLFAKSDYRETPVVTSADVTDLTSLGFNDKLSSLIVVPQSNVTNYVSGSYKLKVYNASKLEPWVINRLVQCWSANYPVMAARFNPVAPKEITLVVDQSEPIIAYALDTTIVASGAHLVRNEWDVDLMTHESAHVLQQYTGANVPGWATEGLADYMRHTYGDFNAKAGWALPSDAEGHYTDGYGVTARFFVWIEKNLRPSFADELNRVLRTGSYGPSFWTTRFDITVDELWSQYVESPAI